MSDKHTQNISDLESFFGTAVIRVTREDLLNDGTLIDVSEAAFETGFRMPIAVTNTVWENYIEWTDEDTKKQTHQDQSGRLHDVLWMARCGIIGAKNSTTQVIFEFFCIPRDGKSSSAYLYELKCIVGPDDQGEPVITILMTNED